jgi:recombination protein U
LTVWKSRGLRGDALEDLIIATNEFYKKQGLGRIDKINTPIKVIELGKDGMITKAFFEKKSTVDFTGVIQGIAVAFDAKETNLKSIPISNIHQHQIEYMKDITDQKGLAFIIIHFKFCDEYFLTPFEVIYKYYNESMKGKRKSIPYKNLDPRYKINRTRNGIIDYISVLNTYLDDKKSGSFL